jgi:hypothetical protein
MSYATQRAQPAPKSGRVGAEYRAAVKAVRERAAIGEPCYFWGTNPKCPGPRINLTLPTNHRHAFTAHHIDRLMDGGHPTPDPRHMAPAHRGCNSWDGLKAQNERRARRTTHPTTPPSPRSRQW